MKWQSNSHRVVEKEEDDEDNWSTASSSSSSTLPHQPHSSSQSEMNTMATCSKGRSSKTLRRSPYFPYEQSREEVIRRYCKSKADNASGTVKYAVTDVDNYFDNAFKCMLTYSFYTYTERPLNTPERWEEVEQILQEKAIHIVKNYKKSSNSIEIEYYVPVTGHLMMNNAESARVKKRRGVKRSAPPKSWLFWNGKFYDPAILYELCEVENGSLYLKPLCPLGVKSHEENIQSFNDDKIKMVGKGMLTKSYRNVMSRKSYLEIDLKKVVDITHIATLGGYPSHVDTFPKIEERRALSTRRICRGKDVRKRRARRSTVYVVRNKNHLSWVKSYTVSYKDITTGKWLQYNQNFDANSDVGSEVLNDLSVRTRYIRIAPNQYHNNKEMRVKIFGKEVITSDSGGSCPEVVFGASDIETIKYVLKPRVQSNYRMDGVRGYSDYYYGCDKKTAKRDEFRKHVREEIHAM